MATFRFAAANNADAGLIVTMLTRNVSASTVIDELAQDWGEERVKSYRAAVLAGGNVLRDLIKAEIADPRSRTVLVFDNSAIFRGYARFYKKTSSPIELMMTVADKQLTVQQRVDAFEQMMWWGCRNVDAITLATQWQGTTKQDGRIDNFLKTKLPLDGRTVNGDGFVTWRATTQDMRNAFAAPP